MKCIAVFVLFGYYLIGCTGYKDTQNAKIMLSSDVVFRTGDSLVFRDIYYPDKKWAPIKVGQSWESQGYDYDGFAWYRIRFIVPSSLRKNFSADSLVIDLGAIDDRAQVFLNGSLLGNPNVVPSAVSRLDSTFIDLKGPSWSQFILGVKDPKILWNKKNIIAIRVFDRGRSGGLMGAYINLRLRSMADSITFNKDRFYRVKGDKLIDTNLVMGNLSKAVLKGSLEILYSSLGNSPVTIKQRVNIDLDIGESASFPVSIPFSVDSGRIDLKYIDFRTKQIVREVFRLPFVLR